ncbi:MAG: SGNH/GDSL hydrolase family protein [Clostridia bacterium]|nr:SGNH/GDSL hydrolase family protein [Clostridia bacterium]
MNIYEYMSVGEYEKPLDRIVTDGGFCSIFRRIGCIGDSLSSGEFESKDAEGNRGFHDYYEYSWGQFIARSAGCEVLNFSKGGMTAKRYMEEFAESKGFWAEDKICQAYIIAFGVNDLLGHKQEVGTLADINKDDYTKNAPTFAGYYAQIIQRLKSMQPRAKFFLVGMPRQGDENDEKRAQHRDILKQMAEFFDRTYFIDLFTYAPEYNAEFKKKYFLGHMTPTGYIVSARIIESYIDYIIRKNPKDFAQVGFIGTDLYYESEEKSYNE